MDDELLELKLRQLTTEGDYELVKTILDTVVYAGLKKHLSDFIDLPQEEQIKLLDRKIEIGKVYEILSAYLTSIFNQRIQAESALLAYETEHKGGNNGTIKS